MYVGPKIDDRETLGRLPLEYQRLLETTNGYVAYDGGLHVRGASLLPEWHSLRSAWLGDDAIHRLFPAVSPDDIPFGEDCLGDQYVLRHGIVWKLSAESGDLVSLELTLAEFDAEARNDPEGFLELAPLQQFRDQGGVLEPGQLLSAYPPFLFKESEEGVQLKAVPNHERRRFLAALARQVQELPDGASIELPNAP